MDLNKLIIFISIMSLILYLNCGKISVLITGFICVFIISYVKNDKSKRFESFFNGNNSRDNLAKTDPTKENPLMNVDLSKDNPNRPPADKSYLTDVENKIKNFVKENANESVNDNLFRDVGDEMELNNSMRQFYTTPNTTIPNDQKSFGNFCYGNMPSDKDKHIQ
jgi:hypothetical protein